MKIWLVTIGEPIFHPLNKLRLHRTGILAKFIAENTVNEVVWWTSTFSHFTKEHSYDSDTSVEVLQGLKMIAMRGKGYKKNISIDRIIDHAQIADKFKRMIKHEEKPDIIVVAFPTMGLCRVAVEYGKTNDVPVLIDYRDMWPEVYVDILPHKFKSVGKFVLRTLFDKVSTLFSEAYGIIGITQDFLDLALQKARRGRREADGVFPLGYLLNQYNDFDLEDAKRFWASVLDSNSKRFRICFFGAIGYQSNWDTIIKAALLIKERNMNVEFVICGSGDKLEEMKVSSNGNNHIFFPGFVSAAQIRSLMEISDIGLCAYLPKESYMNSVPGKAIEYMSGGLPILSTLKGGTLGHLIDDNRIGFHYDHDSAESLINVLNQIIQNRGDLKEMQAKINMIYKENFDAYHVYGEYASHLEKVVKAYIVNKKING